jgi:hypothetical protein
LGGEIMKSYHCEGCGSLVFFENVSCLTCGHALGFLPSSGELTALEPAANGAFRALSARAGGRLYRQCLNWQRRQICNWMVPADDPNPFCASCRLNEVIPNLDLRGNLERWRRLEMAKRRIIYTITALCLPLDSAPDEGRPALRFSFLGDLAGLAPILTGYENGLITVNIAEADDDERERRRLDMHEPYRTLLGHLRHEIGHYYWDRLIARGPRLDRWRELFGNETRPYAAALQSYYQCGPPADWQARCVSAYAAAHPWEDWAETWAHYFHMIDTLETASTFGMALMPQSETPGSSQPELIGGFDGNFDGMMDNWRAIVYMLNSLNRGMGLQDLYPFAPSRLAIDKLRCVHDVVQSAGNVSPSNQQSNEIDPSPAPMPSARCIDPMRVPPNTEHEVFQSLRS